VLIGRLGYRSPIKIAGCSGFDETTAGAELYHCKPSVTKAEKRLTAIERLAKIVGRHNKCWPSECGNIGKSHGGKKRD
jgi:hypothetical protein